MTRGRFLVFAFFLATPLAANSYRCDDVGFTGRLAPNSVAFIARPLPAGDFQVIETLWGRVDSPVVSVYGFFGAFRTSGPQFFVALPDGEGRYLLPACNGWRFDAADPRVDEFRRAISAHAPAHLAVEVTSANIPLAGVRISIRGAGNTFEERTAAGGTVTFDLPAGEYDFLLSRPNFHQEQPAHLSVLPGSTPKVSLPIISNATLSGRLADVRGNPIPNVDLGIEGAPAPQQGSLYNAVMDSVNDGLSRLMGWNRPRSQPRIAEGRTTSREDGSFQFSGVHPGQYRLRVLSPDIPSTYYPSSPEWRAAELIDVGEGKSVTGMVFALPDYGPTRRIELQVVGPNGLGVPGVVILGHRFDQDRPYPQTFDMHRTDSHGRLAFSAYAMSRFELFATDYRAGYPRPDVQFEIFAGLEDVSRRIGLPAIRPN